MIDQNRPRFEPTPILVLFCLLLLNCPFICADTSQVFQIGVKDNSFREFNVASQSTSDTIYVIGKNSSKDWPAYQPGSLDSRVRSSTMQEDWVQRSAIETASGPPTNTVAFSIDAPRGTFMVHLGMIFRYRRAAAPKLGIKINGKPAGTYYLNPCPAPTHWWPNGGEGDGNLQYFGYESLDLPLPTDLFRAGRNTIALNFVDGFGIYYDYLSLSNTTDRLAPRI